MWGFPSGTVVKNPPVNAGDTRDVDFSGGSDGKASAYSAGDPGSILPNLGREDLLEKEMVIHSSILAWKIPWTEKPGRLQAMGSQRVGHD